jgi:hypothetical protein
MTLRISPAGSGVVLVPLAALISRSEGGSGSSSADVGTSSAVSSWASSSLSPSACSISFKNALRELKGGLVGDLGRGLPIQAGKNVKIQCNLEYHF